MHLLNFYSATVFPFIISLKKFLLKSIKMVQPSVSVLKDSKMEMHIISISIFHAIVIKRIDIIPKRKEIKSFLDIFSL